MSWQRKDDGWLMHPKVRAMGLHGRAVWDAASNWSCAQLTDGFVPVHMLASIAVLADVPLEDAQNCAERLVALGSWHRSDDRDCRCVADRRPDRAAATEPGWIIHDHLDYQRARVDVLAERAVKKRSRHLQSKDMEPVRAEVLARDGDLCRYCGTEVVRKGRGSRGPFGATFDHVDPAEGNTVDNLVVSCRRCNSLKKDRTPADAGLTLHPVAGHPAPAVPPPPPAATTVAPTRPPTSRRSR